MNCPNCQAYSKEEDTHCRSCGEELRHTSMSIVTTGQTRVPALLQSAQLPRKVAAGVGAVVLGVGLELLRRGVLTRLALAGRASRPLVKDTLPALAGLKREKSVKLPKGYVMDETIVYTRRVIRRER